MIQLGKKKVKKKFQSHMEDVFSNVNWSNKCKLIRNKNKNIYFFVVEKSEFISMAYISNTIQDIFPSILMIYTSYCSTQHKNYCKY